MCVIGGSAVVSLVVANSASSAVNDVLVGDITNSLRVETDCVHKDAFIRDRLIEIQNITGNDENSSLYMHYVRLVDALDRQLFAVNSLLATTGAKYIEDRVFSFECFKVVEACLTKVKKEAEKILSGRQAAVIGSLCQKLFGASEVYWQKALYYTRDVQID